MPRAIHLYVSSSPDLQPEREVVGQTVALLPLTLGWQIDHTPLPGEPVSDRLARVAGADLYVLILGQDFAAPMGAELQQALNAGREPLAYRKECTLSPSSTDVLRRFDMRWRAFVSPEVLRVSFKRDVLQALLHQATELGLDMVELERLFRAAQEEVERLTGAGREDRQRGDASRSGIILGRELWEEGT